MVEGTKGKAFSSLLIIAYSRHEYYGDIPKYGGPLSKRHKSQSHSLQALKYPKGPDPDDEPVQVSFLLLRFQL
jgi:hypothetical protein